MARRRWVRAVASLVLALALAIPGTVMAGSGEAPLPRFAALHADKVNLRAGPGDPHPIEWVYIRKEWPVRVVPQFDHWRGVPAWVGNKVDVPEQTHDHRHGVTAQGGR